MIVVSSFKFPLSMSHIGFLLCGIFLCHGRLVNYAVKYLPARGQESFTRQLQSLLLLSVFVWLCFAITDLLWAEIRLCMFGI